MQSKTITQSQSTDQLMGMRYSSNQTQVSELRQKLDQLVQQNQMNVNQINEFSEQSRQSIAQMEGQMKAKNRATM